LIIYDIINKIGWQLLNFYNRKEERKKKKKAENYSTIKKKKENILIIYNGEYIKGKFQYISNIIGII